MPLPSSGPIWMSQVNTELGRAANAAIYLGDSEVRGLAGVPSGLIYMSSLLGKSAAVLTANLVPANKSVNEQGYLESTFGSLSPKTFTALGQVHTVTEIANTSAVARVSVRNSANTPYADLVNWLNSNVRYITIAGVKYDISAGGPPAWFWDDKITQICTYSSFPVGVFNGKYGTNVPIILSTN